MTDDLLKPEALMFVRERLEAGDVQELARILKMPGYANLRLANISVLLPLLHEARRKDEKTFWVNLFLPWVSIQHSVRAQHDRILDEFARVGDFNANSPELLIHLVNLYRSIVADLIDPYLTLPLACYQFIEGVFTNIQDANVGLGERNKAEYLESRIKRVDPENRLLSGYEPIVRNAVTHTGSDGVVYLEKAVLFRNIKRGIPPVVEGVEWSQDVLTDKIVRLYECIISTDAGVNIFGVDCGELLVQDDDAKSELIQRALTPEQRRKLRGSFEVLVKRIREDKEMTANQRFELLSRIFLYNCANRNMPVHGIRISSQTRIVMVEIPDQQGDMSNDEVLRDAVLECSHYCILARTVFGPDFEQYSVRTVLESGQSRLSVTLKGKLLEEYIEEQAGLYDLLHEAEVRLENSKVVISVDFQKLSELERKNLGRRFPRKVRPDQNC
jgi:hypothetical protein